MKFLFTCLPSRVLLMSGWHKMVFFSPAVCTPEASFYRSLSSVGHLSYLTQYLVDVLNLSLFAIRESTFQINE